MSITYLAALSRENLAEVLVWEEAVLEAGAQSCCSVSSPVCSEKPLCFEAPRLTAGEQTVGPHIWL